jgi:hypothetical protein
MKPVFPCTPSRFLPLVALAALSFSSPAQQLGHYIGGFTGLENGSTPPPGFYGAAFGLVEPINSIKGPGGNTVLRPDIDVGASSQLTASSRQRRFSEAITLWPS